MDRTITATEANQRFSEMLRDVASGDSFTVLSRGRAVARVMPVEKEDRDARFEKMMEFFKAQPLRQGKPWTREELYEDQDFDD
jgi:prevent-host-death family protein